jgi:ferredoxin--NADP+ reductase
MVSKPDDNVLEFYSVVVPDGKFSPTLASLEPGDPLWIDKTVFGFLTLERFTDGEDLWLIATGTGLSAYLSMLRDPATWSRFKRIILLHGVRHANELAYRQELIALSTHADKTRAQFIYLPITSQEPLTGELSPAINPLLTSPARLTTLLTSGELEQRAGMPLEPDRSRVMLCGNPAMVTEMRALLAERGFAPGRRGIAGNLAVENYW